MGILIVRLTEDEERVLSRRSRQARMRKGTYVRMLIREERHWRPAPMFLRTRPSVWVTSACEWREMDAVIVGRNPAASQRLGVRYDDHRKPGKPSESI
jgi:hypothetical protein